MKKIIELLSNVKVIGLLFELVTLIGLVMADDLKGLLTFGFMFVGASIQVSRHE